jgi:CRP-like cAMP-binding protein
MKIETGDLHIRQFSKHEHLARAGDPQRVVYKIQEGWACTYSVVPDGRRQITAIFLPGDLCEPHWLLAGKAQLPVIAITPMTVTEVPLENIYAQPGKAVQNLLGAMLEAFNRQTDWIVRLGRKSARARVQEFLLELNRRLQASEHVSGQGCNIPLTQQDMADALGLTAVHLNRVLMDLRKSGAVSLYAKTLSFGWNGRVQTEPATSGAPQMSIGPARKPISV